MRNHPKAINKIPIRIVLFYIGALFVIITVTPWNQVDPNSSPFVAMFSLAGIGIAAHFINFVVLTSASSSSNSGIYSTSRMVYGLATVGLAPKAFSKLSNRKVPVHALIFSCIFLLSSVVLLYAGQSMIQVFTLVTTISALLFIFIWSIILVSYLQYRRKHPERHEKSTFKMPGGRASVVMVFIFFAFVLWALTQEPDTLAAMKVTPLWFVLLGIAYWVMKLKQNQC